MSLIKINITDMIRKAIYHYLKSEEFKKLIKEKIELISNKNKVILSMKRYILTENGCILDRQNNECKVYAEEDGMMIEWKDAVITDTSVQYAVIKDKIIKDSDSRKALERAREILVLKNNAEEIAVKVADEECYSDLIDCTTQEDYENFIEKWEDQVHEKKDK